MEKYVGLCSSNTEHGFTPALSGSSLECGHVYAGSFAMIASRSACHGKTEIVGKAASHNMGISAESPGINECL